MFKTALRVTAAVAGAALLTQTLVPLSASAATVSQMRPAAMGAVASSPHSTSALPNSARLTAAQIAKYATYVSADASGRYTVSIPASVVAADPAMARVVRSSVATANKQLTQSAVSVTASKAGMVATLGGTHGGGSINWWGVSLWLDETATNQLIALIGAGAATTKLVAVLTSWTGIGGLSATAIAAILTIGALAIHLCDWNGRGVNFHLAWIGPSWCSPR